MNLLFLGAGYLLNALTAFFLYKFVCCFIKVRKPFVFKILAYLSVYIIIDLRVFPNELPIVVFAMLLFFTLATFAFFKDSLIEKLSTVLILYPTVVAINF